MSGDELDLKQFASGVSSGSVEEFTSSSQKRNRGATWRVDGINLKEPESNISRKDLVKEATDLARHNLFLVVSSPPGTGKTSLLQLVQNGLREENEASAPGKIVGFDVRPSDVNGDLNLFDYVDKKTGVSFENKTLATNLKGCSEVWLLFDDAQRLYGDEFQSFWEDVVKQKSKEPFGKKTKVIVVVFATYYLSTTTDSPAVFRNEQRLGVADLLLKNDEAAELYRRRCMYPAWDNYFQRLFYMSNGAAAAFTIGLNLIVNLTQEVDRKSEGTELSESEALFVLVERIPFGELHRCFPVRKVDAASHSAILDAIVDAYMVDMGERSAQGQEGEEAVTKLTKAGILTETNRFSSPIAQSFYYHEIFPRAPRSVEGPETLDDLIIQAAQKLSARRLRVSRQFKAGGWQSPKEAVFQQLFHEAIASLLPVSYRIIPELGTKAKMDGQVVTGELDFYMKKGQKWALELLRDGHGVGEHLGRIPGKYKNVDADAWLVVDCRLNVKPKKREKQLCTLVFGEDYTTCECYLRLSAEPLILNLAA